MNGRSGTAASGVARDTDAMKNADAEGLFRRYGPMVIRRCRRLLRNDDEAADAAQEVFVKLVGSPELLAAEYPSAMLFKMATNRCLNILRDKARHGGNIDGEPLLERIACSSADNDIEARIDGRGILSKLFVRHHESVRVLAVLHFIDGMTLDEAAKEMGMSKAWARKRLRILRDDLKEIRNLEYGGIL